MAKIYRVIQIKLNQLGHWSLTYQQSVFKRYHGIVGTIHMQNRKIVWGSFH